MEVREIIELMKAVSDNGLTKFELEHGDLKLFMKCKKGIVTVDKTTVVNDMAERKTEPIGNVIFCPLVGTFYTSPSPEAECFVKVGDRVKKGQILGIVEAMKLMNEIESEYEGTVAEILVNNEEIVEYGQPLFVIR